MNIFRNIKVRHLVNILLASWLVIWVYFALFNWPVFAVKLNINLGFAVISSYPFVLLFLVGVTIMLAIRYLLHYSRMLRRMEVKEKNDKIRIQAKDIEILQLKEMLYKLQAEDHSKANDRLSAMHEKLDSIARQISDTRKKHTQST